MNLSINQALTRAAEKVVRRPLHQPEELSLLEGFYSTEGNVVDRIITALEQGTQAPRGLIEKAANRSAGAAGIAEEVQLIRDTWAARN
jgi:hypothetical protein